MINGNSLLVGLGGFSVMALYWIGVNLLVAWSRVLRSIKFIKSVHTVGFVILSALLFAFVYEVAADRITLLTWIAVPLFFAEGVLLITNGWRCPLTAVAEDLGSTHGQVTDTFLPKWFADRVFQVYGILWAATLVLLAIRLQA